MGVFPAPTTGGGGGAPTGPAGGDLAGTYPNPTVPGVATVAGNLTTETVNRIAADSAESTARGNADTTLTNNLATEVTNRGNADTTLTNNLATEVTNRGSADTILSGNINAETAARIAADALLAPLDVAVSNKTAAYTIVLADDGSLITMNGAFNFTIPQHATVPLPVGAAIVFMRIGAGAVAFGVTGSAVINSAVGATPSISAQWKSAVATQIAIDSWVVEGAIV